MAATKKSITSVNLSGTTITAFQLKQLLIQGLAEEKDAMTVIQELADGLYPDEEIERDVIFKKIQREVNAMKMEHKGKFSLEDSSIEEQYRFWFEFDNVENFVEMHAYLKEFSDYLATKYKADVDFYYRLHHFATPAQQQSENAPETPVEKPKPITTFDIELNEAV